MAYPSILLDEKEYQDFVNKGNFTYNNIEELAQNNNVKP